MVFQAPTQGDELRQQSTYPNRLLMLRLEWLGYL